MIRLILLSALLSLPSAAQISGGHIYRAAAQQGYAPVIVNPGSILQNAAGHNWRVYALFALQTAPILGAYFISSGMIAANMNWIVGALSIHGVGDVVAARLRNTAPDASAAVAAIIDPTRMYDAPAAGCVAGIMVATWSKGKTYPSVTVGLPNGGDVTFTPQGPAALRQATGRIVKNVQAVGVIACRQ